MKSDPWGNSLSLMGLTPRTWRECQAAIQKKLNTSDWEKFSRLWRAFSNYRTLETSVRFYDFVFAHELGNAINAPRHNRLAEVLANLQSMDWENAFVLEIGAGAGYISGVLAEKLGPSRVMVQDICSGARTLLETKGLKVLPHPLPANQFVEKKFTHIICVDCLGEINADEDDVLRADSPLEMDKYAEAMEQRYGMMEKLSPYSQLLNESGHVLIWEPLKHQRAWEALAFLSKREGWEPKLNSNPDGLVFLDLKTRL